MHRWARLQEQFLHDAKLQAALAAIMWREALRWPDGKLATQLAKNTRALAGLASALDRHGVRVTHDAIVLTKRREMTPS